VRPERAPLFFLFLLNRPRIYVYPFGPFPLVFLSISTFPVLFPPILRGGAGSLGAMTPPPPSFVFSSIPGTTHHYRVSCSFSSYHWCRHPSARFSIARASSHNRTTRDLSLVPTLPVEFFFSHGGFSTRSGGVLIVLCFWATLQETKNTTPSAVLPTSLLIDRDRCGSFSGLFHTFFPVLCFTPIVPPNRCFFPLSLPPRPLT